MNFNGFDFGGFFDIELALENLPFILGGLPMTLLVAIIGMGSGLVLGLFLALFRGSEKRILRWPARIYISYMRGTPALVFSFILYFGLPMVGIKLTALMAASLGFGLSSAAFIAEIKRAALKSIDKGHWASAKALHC